MQPPRDALLRRSREDTSRPALNGREERGPRDLLAQCERCRAKGTARVRLGSVKSNTLRQSRGRHLDCGGRIVLFDIEVGR